MSETSWCDKLASTPGVGIALDWSYLPGSHYQQAMMPVTAKLVDKDTQAFTIDGLDAYSFAFTSLDGYHYAFNSSRIYCEYRHRLRYQPQSAGPPVAELISKPKPYTELLSVITDRLVEATRLVCATGPRILKRIGIVSTTAVNEEDVPPGIRRFVEYVGKPWGKALNTYNLDAVAEVRATSKKSPWVDRCQHVVVRTENEEALINIRLDYHRIFDSPQNLNVQQLEGMLKNLRSDALTYFEDVAQGERFDERISDG